MNVTRKRSGSRLYRKAKRIRFCFAKSVIAKINGLNGAHFIFQGARYKILKAELNNLSGKPGEIIGDSLEIACKEKSIKVMMIQREGKKPQKTAEFLLGSQIKKGLFLSNV